MLAEYDITLHNLFYFFPQNGCMYVGCGESHADHSTVHSQVRALTRVFLSYSMHDGIGHSQRSVLDLTGGGVYSYDILSYFLCWSITTTAALSAE